eukprot:UN25122
MRGWDISGCGLTGCDQRYNSATPEECKNVCESLVECKAFSFAPAGGDKYHPNDRVCTIYKDTVPDTQLKGADNGYHQIFCTRRESCPSGYSERNYNGKFIGADRGGCGMTDCDSRYSYTTAAECAMACSSTNGCKAISWAPLDGDQYHAGQSVCTLYNEAESSPNQLWPNTEGSYSQIFCKK